MKFVIKSYKPSGRTDEKIVGERDDYSEAVNAAKNWSKSGSIVGVYAAGRVHMVSYRGGQQHLLHPDLDVKGDPKVVLEKFLKANAVFFKSDEEKLAEYFDGYKKLPVRDDISPYLLPAWRLFQTGEVPTLAALPDRIGRPAANIQFKADVHPRTKAEVLKELAPILKGNPVYNIPIMYREGVAFATDGVSLKSIPVASGAFKKDGWYDAAGNAVTPERDRDITQVVHPMAEDRTFLALAGSLIATATAAKRLDCQVGILVRDGAAWIGVVRVKNQMDKDVYVFQSDPVMFDREGSVPDGMTASTVFGYQNLLNNLNGIPGNALLRVCETAYTQRPPTQGGKIVLESTGGSRSYIMPYRGYVQHTKALPISQPTPKQQTPEDSTTSLYFAYGSNMDEVQMTVRCPGSKLLRTDGVDGVELVFVGVSKNWSNGGVANLQPAFGREVYGAVYAVTEEHLKALDRYEGAGYKRTAVKLHSGKMATAYVRADDAKPNKPSDAYRGKIINAYRTLGLKLDKALESPKPVTPETPAGSDSGPAAELERRVKALIADYNAGTKQGKTSWADRKAIGDPFAAWFTETFHVEASNTPSGGKTIKDLAQKFLWSVRNGVAQQGNTAMIESDWAALRPLVPDLVEKFSGATQATTTKFATYKNLKGLSQKTFSEYVSALDGLFGSITGWRSKAFGDTLTVALAGPDKFKGTAGGKYNAESDTLFVRATPDVMKRQSGKYGSLDYILVHELGHRYERRNQLPKNFGESSWYTTRYSRTEGGFGQSESFAELFALGHFGITSEGGKDFGDTLKSFERVMGGSEPKPGKIVTPEVPGKIAQAVSLADSVLAKLPEKRSKEVSTLADTITRLLPDLKSGKRNEGRRQIDPAAMDVMADDMMSLVKQLEALLAVTPTKKNFIADVVIGSRWRKVVDSGPNPNVCTVLEVHEGRRSTRTRGAWRGGIEPKVTFVRDSAPENQVTVDRPSFLERYRLVPASAPAVKIVTPEAAKQAGDVFQIGEDLRNYWMTYEVADRATTDKDRDTIAFDKVVRANSPTWSPGAIRYALRSTGAIDGMLDIVEAKADPNDGNWNDDSDTTAEYQRVTLEMKAFYDWALTTPTGKQMAADGTLVRQKFVTSWKKETPKAKRR